MASGGEETPSSPRVESLFSDSLADHICDPCSAEEKELEATGYCEHCDEYLCDECFSIHTRPTLMKGHSLVKLVEGQLVRTPSMKSVSSTTSNCSLLSTTESHVSVETSSLHSSASIRLTERCVEHDEVIKYFCELHEQLSCDVCMTVHHHNCAREHVSYIPVVARDMRGSQEYRDFCKQKKLTENKTNVFITDAKNRMEMTRHSHSMAKTAREEFKKELESILDKQLAKLNILAVDAELKDSETLDSYVNSFTATLNEIQKLTELLENQQRRTNQCSLYISLKKAKAKLVFLQKSLQNVHLPEVKECRFEPGKELADMLKRGNAFGKLVIEPVRDTKASPLKDIHVRTHSDSEECKITGLALLPENKLVAIDNKNKKIKLVDTRKSKVVSWLRFSHPMWDVTAISNTRVAATVPAGERLAIVKTEPELLIESYIKVSGRCHGVAFTGDTLIVSFTDTFPDKVEFIDLQGKVLQSVATDSSQEWIFSGPRYVSYSPTSRRAYISNWDSGTIVTMDHESNVRSVDTVSDLNKPGKVVHDGKSRLYVSDVETNTILQLSMDMERLRKVLIRQSGVLFGPTCACYEEETDKFFVGMGIATIKVFQLH